MMDDLDIDLDLLPGQGQCNTFQAVSWEPIDLQSSYFAWGTTLGRSLRSTMIGDLDLLSQGHSLAGNILRTVWPTKFIFHMGDQVRKLFKVHHDGWPWPTFQGHSLSGHILRTIRPTEFIFCMGDQVGKVFDVHHVGDLDLLSQGHSFPGFILRTAWPTEFTFCIGMQVTRVFNLCHDEWPWPTFSRSFFNPYLLFPFSIKEIFISLAYFKVYSRVNLAL
jgi:hypothetical protein